MPITSALDETMWIGGSMRKSSYVHELKRQSMASAFARERKTSAMYPLVM